MRETLKLALDALEEPLAPTKRLKAITAIKEALREHAMYEVQRLGQEIQPEPPQRTWVGLTAKETSDFVDQYWANDAVSMKELIGFVEAKLKEKNT